jgi:hypothetical protein
LKILGYLPLPVSLTVHHEGGIIDKRQDGGWCEIYWLKWIRDDTAMFGGGGGVSMLLYMTSIKGLLHKASIENVPNPCGLEPKDATNLS